MKVWYRAVCDTHKEMRTVMVSNPSCTAHYLSKEDREVQVWLERHYGCDLRLAWRDDQLEALWDNGFPPERIHQ